MLVMEEMENILAIPREEVLLVSAKDGTGVPEVLEAIVARIPPPKGDPDRPLQGLIFDSHYDPYKGVVAYVRLFDGRLREHEQIRLMASGAESEILEIGVFRPQLVPVKELGPGEVGYVATGLKSVRDAQVGDTMTSAARPASEPLPGYKPAKPLVFAGLYPVRGEDLPELRDALEKLHLNDALDQLRARDVSRAGHGLPLRVPRAAAHGDRPGAPGARVRPRPHRLRAIGRVPRPVAGKSRRGRRRQPGACCRRSARSRPISEPWVKLSVITPSQYIGTLDGALNWPARNLPDDGVHRRRSGACSPLSCRSPR